MLVSPVNGAWPVVISYTTTPMLKMSDRASSSRPRACSGDMYCGVPRIVPGLVPFIIAVAFCESNPCSGGVDASVSLARPKSRTFR